MKILFLGDIFGEQAIVKIKQYLPKLITKNQIDFVIAQGENISGRKGLIPKDYEALKSAGVDAFTMGNHVWAKDQIHDIIENEDIIRPYNVGSLYPGQGTRVFTIKGKRIRVTQLMGIVFNKLNEPWNEFYATNFFDAFDEIDEKGGHDIHFIDFHGETTSEKNVFGLYIDGKADALVGTHTHVQTNDARVLPKGTTYITDAGMVGPMNSAIGASFESVYKKMRFDERSKFKVSDNPIFMNAVIITINKNDREIKTINKILR